MEREKDAVLRVRKSLLHRVKVEAVKEGKTIKQYVEKNLEIALSKKTKQV